MVNEVDLRLRYKQEKGDILVTGLVPVINESIKNILGTRIGNRLFNRSFGSSITSLLFEPMSDAVARFILIETQQVLERLEPRIIVSSNRSQIKPDYDNNLYTIRLKYIVLETGETGEFNTFLESQAA